MSAVVRIIYIHTCLTEPLPLPPSGLLLVASVLSAGLALLAMASGAVAPCTSMCEVELDDTRMVGVEVTAAARAHVSEESQQKYRMQYV